jgi:hypothetical protein
MTQQYKRGENPRSLANLGKPKTKAGRFNFTLTEQSVKWLNRQANKSAAIDKLIQQKINQEHTMTAIILPISINYYGDVDESEHQEMVSTNQARLEEMGLHRICEYGRGTDCYIELWSNDDSLTLCPGIVPTVKDKDGNEVEQAEFEIF